MARRGKSRTFRVPMGREGVLERICSAPVTASEPPKNLFALARPPAPSTLKLHDAEDGLWVTWAREGKRGCAELRIDVIDDATTELEVRAARAPEKPWKHAVNDWAAIVVLSTIIASLVTSGLFVLLLVGLVVMLIFSDGRRKRMLFARECDAVAAEVHARFQPFVLQEEPPGPYRELAGHKGSAGEV